MAGSLLMLPVLVGVLSAQSLPAAVPIGKCCLLLSHFARPTNQKVKFAQVWSQGLFGHCCAPNGLLGNETSTL
jgi:hypothetical protein